MVNVDLYISEYVIYEVGQCVGCLSSHHSNAADKKDESLSAMEEASRKKNSSELFDFEDEAWEQLDSIPQKKNIKRVIFGHDIFNNKKLTFEPEMNIATPSDYKLGPGDAVFIDIWGASQKSISSTVSPEGEIDIEGFGPIQVSGLTVAQANSRLKATIGSRYSGSNIKLSVGQTKTISVNVMGAVETPGTYALSAFSTVFHALYMAGGVSEIGSLRDIRVFRNGRQISTVDIYDYILNGKLSGNIKLSSGDIIIVNPYECLVNITGKIKRPMFYEMKKNESVATLLKYAGGFAGDAYTKNLRLVRKAGGVKSVYTIDEFERTSFQLMDEDSVFVDSTLNRYSNMVEIKGAVFRPGMYQVDGNISTVRQLIERAGGMTEDAVTTRGIMHRMTKERSLQAVSLDLKGIMEHTSPDVSLQNEDVIYIPSNRERKLQRFLKIAGEVQHPGEFDYAEGTTLEDLILRAGGLTDAASLIKIEVSRRIRNASATKAPLFVAKTYSFEMKDGHYDCGSIITQFSIYSECVRVVFLPSLLYRCAEIRTNALIGRRFNAFLY
jgi:protein involved in polysaccharide export with SLBB domain